MLTAAAGLVAGSLSFAPEAVARPIDQGTFHDEFTDEFDDFCGVEGLHVTADVSIDGRFLMNIRKPGTAPYYQERITITEVDTNDDGDSVTSVTGVLQRDLKITDNGDGTVTILVLATGPANMYDNSTGKAIARDPGQIRFEILIDLNGTPTNPDDDEFIAFLGQVKGSTGRSDDYCEGALSVLG